MSINSKLDNLYTKWSDQYSTFIKGGVINEEDYSSAPIKVLFILKEVNSNDNNWSLVDLVNRQVQERKFYDIWDTIGLWSCAIFNGFKSYNEIRKIANYFANSGLCESLTQIATTNIKKTCGGGQSNSNEIWDYGRRDRDFLLEEIEIINPDVVICGGTFTMIKEIYGLNIQECCTGVLYSTHKNKLFIDMPHPRARVGKNVVYTYFKETMLELENKNILTFRY